MDIAIGQKVRVNMGRRGGIQEGTITAIHANGRFTWKNRCNLERRASVSQITTEPERAGVLDPYVQAWVDDPGEDS